MSDKKKFFFDLHNFSDDADEEEGPPPPPTFSEDELAQARDAAYNKGKQDGYNESQQSLEKDISVLLENAKYSFLELQEQETAREKRYEEEAVYLALEMFKSIYPAWLEDYGPEEVENAIEAVLHSVANQQTIRIEVAPPLLSAVEERFKPIQETLSEITVTFHGNEALGAGDMRMKWENGGAVRDSNALAARILQSLMKELPESVPATVEDDQEDLADTGETRHNEDIETEKPDE